MKRYLGFFILLLVFISGIFVIRVDASGDKKMTVYSVDAGRKYFSKQQLKSIIDKLSDKGFTSMHLMLGNDGMRFLLDDMTVNANGKVYNGNDVKDAIIEGNKNYYNDPNGNYLNESEMDEILSYAREKGIDIIPSINSPGHMDALLKAIEILGEKNPAFHGSKRTIDLENSRAIELNKAIITKYADYFSQKGVKYFSLGCDEYANDVDLGGWKKLQSSGLYKKFVEYVNSLANIMKARNMRPICFNDGIYYNNDDSFGNFDKDIIISYWTAGWGGYNVAKPKYFIDKGHQILNTNDNWYFVLGDIDKGYYHYNKAMKVIDKFDFNDMTGGYKDIPTIGSMMCLWCDNPEKPHDMERVFSLIDKFSDKYADYMSKKADYTKVNEAIAKKPEDLTYYTEESIKRLEEAIQSVQRNLTSDKQTQVDEYAKAIEEAIRNLELKKADYSIVDEIIAKKPKDLSKYTEKSVEKLEKAIKDVDRNLTIDKQNKVDGYAKVIEEAIKNLELKKVDYSIVDELTAKKLKDSSKYTEKNIEKNNLLPRTSVDDSILYELFLASFVSVIYIILRYKKN